MSYLITLNGDPFCSSNAEKTAVLNPTVTLEANKAGSLKFTMLPDHPMYSSIVLRSSVFAVFQNGEQIFEGVPTSETLDFYNRKTVVCEGELGYLNDTIQRQVIYQNQSVSSLLGAYLAVHNAQADASKQFTVGSVTVSGGNSIYRLTNYNNTMTEIGEDLIDNFGGFLRVRHSGGVRYLDYLDDSPRTSSQIVSIGKNLVNLSQNLDSLDICTVLIPLGAKTGNQLVQGLDERLTIKSVNSNLDYLVGTAQATYGSIWRTHVWDDVTTASALKTKGQNYLSDAQWANLVISATALDLGLTDNAVQQFQILDMIRVVSEPHGLDRYFMLTKLQINLDHPSETQITLGQETKLSLSARTAQNGAEIEKEITQVSVNAAENARQILESATGGNIYFVYDSNGVCTEMRIMDTNNPLTATKWWTYNINGWGYRDSGGTYTAAATMDGTIYANQIKAGLLSSPNDVFSVNMATGNAVLNDLSSSNATITGGSLSVTGSSDSDARVSVANSNWRVYTTPAGITIYDKTANKTVATIHGISSVNGKSGTIELYNGDHSKLAAIYSDVGLVFSDVDTLDEVGKYPYNKFLTNLGAVSSENGTQISLATATWKDSCSINLSANTTYLINGIVSFASNNSGYRRIVISDTADSSTPINQYGNVVVAAANGLATRANVTMIYRPSAATTIHLNVYQNSGSSLNTTGYLQVMTIEG